MNCRNILFICAVHLSCSLVCLSQTAIMLEGHPALECVTYFGVSYIRFTDYDGQPAFKIRVSSRHFGFGGRNGTLFLTAQRVVFQSDSKKASDSFDELRTAITLNRNPSLDVDEPVVQVGGRKYDFFALPEEMHSSVKRDDNVACSNLLFTAFKDFAAAEKRFNQLIRWLPSVQEEAWRGFRPKAAAWRTMYPKPPLGPEADRQRLLAENAFKERDLDSAIGHYERALEVQPTWPDGWFNLAIIYGEQKSYAEAVDAMKHYLELVTDAQDAKSSREQMFIWEDKVKH